MRKALWMATAVFATVTTMNVTTTVRADSCNFVGQLCNKINCFICDSCVECQEGIKDFARILQLNIKQCNLEGSSNAGCNGESGSSNAGCNGESVSCNTGNDMEGENISKDNNPDNGSINICERNNIVQGIMEQCIQTPKTGQLCAESGNCQSVKGTQKQNTCVRANSNQCEITKSGDLNIAALNRCENTKSGTRKDITSNVYEITKSNIYEILKTRMGGTKKSTGFESEKQGGGESAKPSVRETTKQSNREITKQEIQETTKQSVRETTKQSVRETTKQSVRETTKQSVRETQPQSYDRDESTYVQQVVNLVNQERAKAGLGSVSLDTTLKNAAMTRAKEIEISFAHTRPNGTSFSTVLSEYQISYRGCGENIAWGQMTPQEVMNGWMNSAGHRANILNANYKKIGVGYYKSASGRKYWSQLFIY